MWQKGQLVNRSICTTPRSSNRYITQNVKTLNKHSKQDVDLARQNKIKQLHNYQLHNV